MKALMTCKHRMNLSYFEMRAAARFARKAGEIEKRHSGPEWGPAYDEITVHVISAIVMAASSLEAFINEVFLHADIYLPSQETSPFIQGDGVFPDKCMSYGCARWCVESALIFADDCRSRTGVQTVISSFQNIWMFPFNLLDRKVARPWTRPYIGTRSSAYDFDLPPRWPHVRSIFSWGCS